MNARWFLVGISVAALGLATAGIVAARTYARGRWTVVEFKSRGPHRTAKVLVNDRTGVVCEVNRLVASRLFAGVGRLLDVQPAAQGRSAFPAKVITFAPSIRRALSNVRCS